MSLLFAVAGMAVYARPAMAQYNTVLMSFGLTTAATAAVGAPFGYMITESVKPFQAILPHPFRSLL